MPQFRIASICIGEPHQMEAYLHYLALGRRWWCIDTYANSLQAQTRADEFALHARHSDVVVAPGHKHRDRLVYTIEIGGALWESPVRRPFWRNAGLRLGLWLAGSASTYVNDQKLSR